MTKRSNVGVKFILTASAVLSVFGHGVAHASGPDVSGQTYGDAAKSLSGWGYTPVIATVVGDRLSTDDCIVTSSAKASGSDASGKSRASQILLNLNCNAPIAQPGVAGNSAASPEGRKAAQEQRSLIWYGQDPSRCDLASWGPNYCKSLCNKYPDLCSAELQAHLA